MTCRTCYALTLSPDECDRFHAEPVTDCIYYCPEHQAEQDKILVGVVLHDIPSLVEERRQLPRVAKGFW